MLYSNFPRQRCEAAGQSHVDQTLPDDCVPQQKSVEGTYLGMLFIAALNAELCSR